MLGAPRCAWESFAEQSATGRFGEPLRFGFSVPAGTYSPVVGDGYYVMLAPLSSGQHTLSFSGTAGSFSLNVTYQLKVGS